MNEFDERTDESTPGRDPGTAPGAVPPVADSGVYDRGPDRESDEAAAPAHEVSQGELASAVNGPRELHVSWQLVLLPILAVLAIVGGFLIGRQVTASRSTASNAVSVAGAARSGVAANPQPGMPVQQPGAPAASGTLPGGVAPAQDSGAAASSLPGVPPDRVVPMPESIHVLRGKPAPDLTMTRLDTGESMSLADLKGQPVLVNFWATWCAPCRIEMPWIQAVYDEHKDEGLVVLSVDAGEKVPPSMLEDQVRRFVDSMGMTFPVLYGDNTFDVQKAWTVIGLPITFLVDADGTVVDVHSGAYPNRATLEDHVSQLFGSRS